MATPAPMHAMDPAFPSDIAWLTVLRQRPREHRKELVTARGGIEVNRFAAAGVGDEVRADALGRVWVRTRDGSVPVLPVYREAGRLPLSPGLILPYTMQEVDSAELLSVYRELTQYHYRSDEAFGRRAVLVLTTPDPSFPEALGFVELTTPFLHLRNRSQLFAAPFSEPALGIAWKNWDLSTRNRLTNAVVRISRIVVHPEVRGLGLTRPLISHAADYARLRWQVRGLRPVFLEITADMLRLMPFVRGTGLRYIGESEGNLRRVARDMAYLLRASEARRITGTSASGQTEHSVLSGSGGGILSRQRRDLTIVSARLATPDAEAAEALVNEALEGGSVGEELLPMLRHPKPTYMMGLSPNAAAFVASRCSVLGLSSSQTEAEIPAHATSGMLKVSNLSVEFQMDAGDLTAPRSSEVRRAFGLTRAFRFLTGVRNLTFTAAPGDVVYIYGASGAGKSTLLDMIAGRQNPSSIVSGTILRPRDATIGELARPEPGIPLVRAIGAPSLEVAILALNASGLAEPRLYLSAFEQLSAGQRYRAQLATLICSGHGIWLLDEFASGLDDATGIAVARSFAKMARRLSVILVAAGVRYYPIVYALRPKNVVKLSSVGQPVVLQNEEEIRRSGR
jgi:ABC-type transport system involved in cytochrome c biogenesis ATPase subunit/GNAT superfamily N-acetyltransferase